MASANEKTISSSSGKSDPCWKYVQCINPNNKNDLKCNFCNKVTKGEIFRAKQHIVGGFRNTTICQRCPPPVREEIQSFMINKVNASKMLEGNFLDNIIEEDAFGGDEEDADERTIMMSSHQGSSKILNAKKRQRQKGPMDLYFTQNAENSRKKEKNLKQTTINDTCKKELRERACREIARWLYDAAILFNAVKYPQFQVMIDAIGQYGIGMKAPSYHEVRVSLLNKEMEDGKKILQSYEEEWAHYGCSIMADGWTDKRNRTLINFLVNSPKGTVFLESIDASGYAKTGEKMFELLDRMVQRVGEKNVIQVVTDSASVNVFAGKRLEEKYKNLFWTPCAAHCLDLILEDIGKMPNVKRTVQRGISLNSFIYVRPGMVNMLRSFTGQRELVRPGVTRFATAFLTLQRIHKLKNCLRKMFTSEEWEKSKWSKEIAGKKHKLV
ncbi:uncharacterized protein LOC120263558 isoform X1 [Dioscorea cayenensis subsp. rotundata]|uniref:Uncharacterized protein LOC120263558 isoform X1 n=1 Tax=Dioscorea cayennensis subsp. rotundata TaxID=55577 RepID=A0AB40BJ73_DIOCR|nr:uncharacterized protein LOC120263558 isoform X1 [Dioscorea cayenensis subsp. rotundata]XP_039127455.1 uncharacterized protein LOC120263558 isoform X1 [Dioscorea cayenensis subsp. rotundata]